MNSKFHNIAKVLLTLTLITSVSFLNFGLPVCIGMAQGDCCSAPKNVPKCCRYKEAKQVERISKHCGCEMKEAGKQVDLYIDLLTANNKTSFKDFDYTSIAATDITFSSQLTSRVTHPPPLLSCGEDIYITNRNLRI